jgi:histidine ammonia-lyase
VKLVEPTSVHRKIDVWINLVRFVGSCMTIHMTHHYTCCRCIPQVHGSVLENLASSRHQLEVEMNSSTDNPLIFEDTPCPITGQPLPNVISAGNFHGEYPAKALDTLALYVGELGRISVARTMILIDPNRNRGLPAFCAPNPGVNSGFMCWELTAVS